MSHKHELIAEMQMEAASTRKILERIPTDKNDWKPHAKSMKLGNLAAHIADLPTWAAMTMQTDEFDLATMDYKPTISTSNEQLVGIYNEAVNKAIAALEGANESDFDKMWTLRHGDHVIFSMPKKAVLRSSALSHSYHHRGQMSVYLRLLDVHVPGMYGPSADDMMANAPAAASN